MLSTVRDDATVQDHGVSENAFCTWNPRHPGLESINIRKYKDLLIDESKNLFCEKRLIPSDQRLGAGSALRSSTHVTFGNSECGLCLPIEHKGNESINETILSS
jgi:hypothetical protein